jgi:hypothetical protein
MNDYKNKKVVFTDGPDKEMPFFAALLLAIPTILLFTVYNVIKALFLIAITIIFMPIIIIFLIVSLILEAIHG